MAAWLTLLKARISNIAAATALLPTPIAPVTRMVGTTSGRSSVIRCPVGVPRNRAGSRRVQRPPAPVGVTVQVADKPHFRRVRGRLEVAEVQNLAPDRTAAARLGRGPVPLVALAPPEV